MSLTIVIGLTQLPTRGLSTDGLTATPSDFHTDSILMQDGSFLLLEDGSTILLQ